MNRRRWIALPGFLVLSVAAFYAYRRYGTSTSSARGDLLGMMPADASAVLFVDVAEMRTAPFVAQLFAWAPQPEPDEDYAQFLRGTGFHYERDLDHLAIAFEKIGQDSGFFAVAEGRFDRQKISAVATKSGSVEKRGGHEIFTTPESGGAKRILFTFLGNSRIVLTDHGDLAQTLNTKKKGDDSAEWRTRFDRLGGSPVFAVIRQDASPGETLSSQAPGGFRSPQLSSVLDQLQWITLAGKPENDRLRIVAEGECSSEEITRQFADVINGVLALAEAALNDAKTRQQLDPALRESYLELLKSADVSKLDRGDTKSIRLTFEITPAFLESARHSSAGPASATPAKPAPGSVSPSKKGRS
jgi:hypothetical protein